MLGTFRRCGPKSIRLAMPLLLGYMVWIQWNFLCDRRLPIDAQHVEADMTAGPTPVLVLSYQRCGSSFFGGLFDKHPQGFYVYEPLDSLYTAMYGTEEGWNVPADIMNYPNGSERTLPREEIEAVSTYLVNLLSCRITALPTETLLHKFWGAFNKFQTSLNMYIECHNMLNKLPLCRYPIEDYCDQRFIAESSKSQDCNKMLWDDVELKPRRDLNNMSVPEGFKRYQNCIAASSVAANGCGDVLERLCSGATMRATKTVRASMDSMEAVINKLPNVKVIHLIRDPRAVVLSRKRFDRSGQSMYASGDIVKEAKVYCQSVVHDVRLRHRLQATYPSTFLEVVYDAFVQDPLKHTHTIYSHVGFPLPANVSDWVMDNSQIYTNSTNIATKWQDSITFRQASRIRHVCREFYRLVQHPWA